MEYISLDEFVRFSICKKKNREGTKEKYYLVISYEPYQDPPLEKIGLQIPKSLYDNLKREAIQRSSRID